MKLAKDLLNTPSKDVVFIDHRQTIDGEDVLTRYLATEEDCRYLQTLIMKGEVSRKDYLIIDTDKQGEEYNVAWRDQDGILAGSFTSNLYSYNSQLSIFLMRELRERSK